MTLKNCIYTVSLLIILNGCGHQGKQPVDFIHPMIGAVGPSGSNLKGYECGRTFPGPATPFGLVQLSPDTYTGGDNPGGYSYFNNTIEGFSFTHLSGTGWYGDFGNFLVMPTTGELNVFKGKEDNPGEGYRSCFSHSTEQATAGYYAVTLEDYDIRAELTAAPRAGIIRFTFPEKKQSRIQIDLARRIGGTSTEQYVKVVDDHTICGWMKCPSEGGGFGNGKGNVNYTVYFYCQFSKALENYGVWSADIPEGQERHNRTVNTEQYQKYIRDAEIIRQIKDFTGKHLGFFTEFETGSNEVVILKSGISFVSIQGAKENLEHDIPDWDFDAVKEESEVLWKNEISKIQIEGGSEKDKTIFYTALYHTLIDPRSISDFNGNYMGADNKIHQTKSFTYRTIFSGWDVFRSQFPLQTILNPEIINDEINSFIQLAEMSGKYYFPRWEFLNSYTGCMIGEPAVSVLTDAYQKGIRNYDIEKAFLYAKNGLDILGNDTILGYTPYYTRWGDLSSTLENSYFDWCIAVLADSLKKPGISKTHYKRAKAFQNIWCDSVQCFRIKTREQKWLEWKGILTHGQGCTESNPNQQRWFVPHDIEGLKQLMGEEKIIGELSMFFDSTPGDFKWNDYYNHANEPVHHVPFMFNALGAPWLTQKWTRKICENAYNTGVLGLVGNEDVGQMSAWYILSAIGIHPLCPGDNKYQITSPVFDKIRISLDKKYHSGKTFTIEARNNSGENIYIQSAKLNGKTLDRCWIYHNEIVHGGKLILEMGPEPNKRWGKKM
jgi:predicted alpha-1,2-mannosidase